MSPEDAVHLLEKANSPPEIIEHSRAVAECAREIAVRYNKRHPHSSHADLELVVIGALLHDIGRAQSDGIDHAVLGAEIARSFGLDVRVVRIIERHIGSGIPDRVAAKLGLPEGNYLPETIEEMIVAHADNLVDGVLRIGIDERIRRMKRRGFDGDAIERMIGLHNAVMG